MLPKIATGFSGDIRLNSILLLIHFSKEITSTILQSKLPLAAKQPLILHFKPRTLLFASQTYLSFVVSYRLFYPNHVNP